jgi:signal transduction histidine kinase
MAPLWETTAPFALFMFSTVIAAWFLGTGPAILTGAAGLLTRIYVDSPRVSQAQALTWEEAVRLTLFGGFIVAATVVLRRMREDRQALEARIEEARRELDERRRIERALDAARAAAEDASRMKDEFLALVSHELRTPLNAVLGWVSLLRGGTLPPERATYALEIVHRNARAQAQIVEDLLDGARSLTGQLPIERTETSLGEVIRAAVAAIRPVADAKGVTLIGGSGSEPLPLFADASRLEQVLRHLLANSVKFTPPGGTITVEISAGGGDARLVVADTGVGIEPTFLPHLFERFAQADGGSTRRHGGLGLGLAIVRHIVELHGGSVVAESDGPGRGARFTVRLPLARGAARVERAARHVQTGSGTPRQLQRGLGRERSTTHTRTRTS